MQNNFNGYCSQYYYLTQQLEKEAAYLKRFLDNAPLYQGEIQLSEIDNLIKYYRKTQEVKAAVDKTRDQLNKTAATIVMIMQYFDITPGTILHGVIEDEIEFDVWADETDNVYIVKTKQLAPEPGAANVITIRPSGSTSVFDDEEDWFPRQVFHSV